MPTYEYECQKCSHLFEQFQSITAEPLKRCPKCRGKVKRLLGTGAGIIFKGSGFYQTDYRPESYKKAAKADSASASESSPASSKSDTSSSKKSESGAGKKSGKAKAD